jgi:ubiquinone/menaquinone biosynthesis C-methylase UbiE
MTDPWWQVDASGEAARLIEVLEERGSTSGLAELRNRWLDFADVRPGSYILDVGCGTGVVARDLARRVGEQGRVVGVDPSRQFIQEAATRARAEGVEGRIEFRCADGAALPFPDNRFDLVVASNVFSHVAHGLQVLAEMTRVLRPEGAVVVFDHDIDTIAVTASDRGLSRRIIHAYCDDHFTSGWAARELYGLFRQVALEEIRILPLVLSSTEFEGYWQQVVERASAVAVKTDAVSQEEADRWREDLERKGREGRFFGCRNYCCVRGRKP